MNSSRKTAIIVGVLFIIGTVAGILSVVFTSSILYAPDYLVTVSANETQITIGALFVLIMGFSLAMIPLIMYPILKKQNEALAIGYIVFRGALETVTYIAIGVSMLLLLKLSQEFVYTGASNASYFQTLGILLLKARDLASLNTIFIFGLGALMLYYLLYQANLIPRWLSIWGFIATIAHLATGLLMIFGLQKETSVLNTIMNFPILLQEMVMAVWLIVKGFNSTVINSMTDKE
jgi:hypothetical protein